MDSKEDGMHVNLGQMPDEVIGLILKRVPIKDLVKACTQVSKQWHRILSEEFFWKEKFEVDCSKNKSMKLLEVADHFGLIKLKQHCLDAVNMLDFMKNIDENCEIYNRLSEATQKELHANMKSRAEEFRDLTSQLEESSETSDDKVELSSKLVKAVLGPYAE